MKTSGAKNRERDAERERLETVFSAKLGSKRGVKKGCGGEGGTGGGTEREVGKEGGLFQSNPCRQEKKRAVDEWQLR